MRILTAFISLGRILFGTVFISQPNVMDQGWIGKQARLPGAQVLSRAVGARDLALGLGGLQAAVRNDGSARAWMAAASLCDAVDFGATYAAGRKIPRSSRTSVLAVAAGAAALSALAAIGSGPPKETEPKGVTEDVTEADAVPTEPVGTA
jgi:hypothetical protein